MHVYNLYPSAAFMILNNGVEQIIIQFADDTIDFNLLDINFSTDLEQITELIFSPTIKSIKKNVTCLASKVSYTNWENSCH